MKSVREKKATIRRSWEGKEEAIEDTEKKEKR